MANIIRGKENKEILRKISNDELAHYEFWKKKSGRDVKPDRIRILFYLLLSRLFGIIFAIKLMEQHEARAQKVYGTLTKDYSGVERLVEDEVSHEEELIGLIDEKRLHYTGSIVRGMNDGIVEITGEVAGLSFVFNESLIIGIVALITGSVSSLSLASSEYLAAIWEKGHQTPIGSAAYTVVAYMLTILILIWPLLIGIPPISALAIIIVNAVILIFIFNYHLCVAKDLKLGRRFGQMLLVSLGIALISFVLGYVIKHLLHLEV
ncbi:MAG: VIT1/CCC1 family protein [Methanomassiliicoccales archaeon]|nr:VIT1/CCC1 family protein [Methanomassiliicoccales archaeon]